MHSQHSGLLNFYTPRTDDLGYACVCMSTFAGTCTRTRMYIVLVNFGLNPEEKRFQSIRSFCQFEKVKKLYEDLPKVLCDYEATLCFEEYICGVKVNVLFAINHGISN